MSLLVDITDKTDIIGVNEAIITKLLTLNIGTRDECVEAYLSTDNKTNINEMKQFLINKSDNMTDSYTDDIKENDIDDIDDLEDEIELLPVGLLPQYEQKTFTTDQQVIEKTSPIHGWSLCDSTTFDVRRGPNYVSGQKSPSQTAIYEPFAMDTYSVPYKMNQITQFMDIDKYIKKYSYPINHKYPLPPILIINIMVPNYSPEIANYKTYNGKGYQVIIYAKLSESIQKLLIANKHDTNILPHASIRLLSRFVNEGSCNTNLRDRFKCLGRVMNVKYTGFNFFAKKLITEYNAKPFLAKCSTVIHHKKGKYLCIDLDAHQFGYLAKKCWNCIKTIMENVIYDLAFIIQGNSNDQLPEQILTSVRISKVAAQKQKPIPQIYINEYQKNNQKHNK